jgi:hypothetical protein
MVWRAGEDDVGSDGAAQSETGGQSDRNDQQRVFVVPKLGARTPIKGGPASSMQKSSAIMPDEMSRGVEVCRRSRATLVHAPT